MKEYRKIPNIFKFDPDYKTVIGKTEVFEVLKNLEWIGTEKIDGTNIRVYWDGHDIQIAGRTDRADIPKHLMEELNSLFLTEEMEYLFEQTFGDKEVYLFGEGYGPKIQANGELYSNEPGFVLFDVTVNGYELSLENVFDVGAKLGLKCVPLLFVGTLDRAIEYVAGHYYSHLGDNSEHEMEGLVLRTRYPLYDKDGHLIKCKCKYGDVIKLKGSVESNNKQRTKW